MGPRHRPHGQNRRELHRKLWHLRFRLLWREFWWVSIPVVLFSGIFGVMFYEPIEPHNLAAEVRSVYVCERFDYATLEAVNCNHIFHPMPEAVAVYEVILKATSSESLRIAWFKEDALIHMAENRFETQGVSLKPGEYLLASPFEKPLTSGDYRVDFLLQDELVASMRFTVLAD